MDKSDKEYIDHYVDSFVPEFHPKQFVQLYEQDGLGNLIRNVNLWLKERFENLI